MFVARSDSDSLVEHGQGSVMATCHHCDWPANAQGLRATKICTALHQVAAGGASSASCVDTWPCLEALFASDDHALDHACAHPSNGTPNLGVAGTVGLDVKSSTENEGQRE